MVHIDGVEAPPQPSYGRDDHEELLHAHRSGKAGAAVGAHALTTESAWYSLHDIDHDQAWCDPDTRVVEYGFYVQYDYRYDDGTSKHDLSYEQPSSASPELRGRWRTKISRLVIRSRVSLRSQRDG